MLRNITSLLLTTAVLLGCGSNESGNAAEKIAVLRAEAAPAEREWRDYLGDRGSAQYSPLSQVNRDNVQSLEVAWTYDPEDGGDFFTMIPTNPLVVNGVLYGLSAAKNLFALDAATGEELWVYPFDRPLGGKGAGRGVVYWEGEVVGQAAHWILVGLGHDLFAIDAYTGALVESFGNEGSVDLRVGLDRPVDDVHVSVIAPGTLYKDLLIQGFGTSEMYDAAPGYIRAYHIPSGELRWTFRTIPAEGELGADTWPADRRDEMGGANSWAGITVDTERGIAYVPTGSAAYDYYGANRPGDNLFANSLVALNAATGERLWHYQFVRHDLWDRDLPTPPNLVTVTRDGKEIPAVAQATKSGHVFVFNRETGEPLVPIEEVAVLGEGTPGEHPVSSQPLPTAPPPFTQQAFALTDIEPASTEYIREMIEGMYTDGPFRLPDEKGNVIYPGLDGGAEWGGQAWDADSGLYFVNANEVPWYFSMVPTEENGADMFTLEFGYMHFCGGCHGPDRTGSGDIFPSLRNIGDKYWPWEVFDIVRNGKGRMPAFTAEPWYLLMPTIFYLYTTDDEDIASVVTDATPTGYMHDGFRVLLDEFKLPGSRPPWGSLTALDLNNNTIAWRIPFGDYPQAKAKGLSGLGAENYGGPVVTAGGLLFIGATPDSMFRAFDKATGKLLWEDALPAAGFATPAIYEAGGRQFIVIAAGGGRVGQASGSAYVAYALP
ncbi:MAG: pyrroloquinoline quinone-dependent dehydrogenase [Halioglobus sp.]|nr:pyrroloquinoline quinone-dependent dehydrogenase [Halioglobus sp.]